MPIKRVLRIVDIVALPEVDVRIAAGAAGETNAIRWLHTSELPDPTAALEGGELLLSGGLGLGATAATQRAYVRRLAERGAAGLGLAVGDGALEEIPPALLEEAQALGLPVLRLGAGTPLTTLAKLVLTRLASDPIAQAHAVQEELVEAVLGGAGARDLLRIVGGALSGSLLLSDADGVALAEHHDGRRRDFDAGAPGAQTLQIGDGPAAGSLLALPSHPPFGAFEQLVLRHGQNALALELTRRQAVLAAELRLGGDLLEDLEQERLDPRETARRLAAFGLDAQRSHAALIAIPGRGGSGDRLRVTIARHLSRHGMPQLSATRHDGVAFLVDAPSEDGLLALAATIAEEEQGARVAVGRAATGPGLGRSLLEARAALDASSAPVVSWRDLSSFELLLSVPVPVLEAFVERVLGPTANSGWLVETLSVLLESGCRWKDAAEQLGVHRHTLRYRMDRLQEQTGRHPDRADQRMELWLAVKAIQAIAMRNGGSWEARTDRV